MYDSNDNLEMSRMYTILLAGVLFYIFFGFYVSEY